MCIRDSAPTHQGYRLQGSRVGFGAPPTHKRRRTGVDRRSFLSSAGARVQDSGSSTLHGQVLPWRCAALLVSQ
eukprot:11506031-Alexandrium_andersonii.AAC.1